MLKSCWCTCYGTKALPRNCPADRYGSHMCGTTYGNHFSSIRQKLPAIFDPTMPYYVHPRTKLQPYQVLFGRTKPFYHTACNSLKSLHAFLHINKHDYTILKLDSYMNVLKHTKSFTIQGKKITSPFCT